MDCRHTLTTTETFLDMLKALHQSGQKAHLLIDDNGISRCEGFIKKMDSSNGTPFIELDNNTLITLDKIIAVNGVFRPEYGEC